MVELSVATSLQGLNPLLPVTPMLVEEVGLVVKVVQEVEEEVVNLALEVQTRDLEVVGPKSNRSLDSGGVGGI